MRTSLNTFYQVYYFLYCEINHCPSPQNTPIWLLLAVSERGTLFAVCCVLICSVRCVVRGASKYAVCRCSAAHAPGGVLPDDLCTDWRVHMRGREWGTSVRPHAVAEMDCGGGGGSDQF